jgi:glucuronoarabinoxylan endo-1,4-beta-xylanase
MKLNVRILLGFLLALPIIHCVAQPTVRIDTTKTHQRITGFGGFVCSPQFQYNHMSNADIKKVWGPTSTVGCNIMRLYIPIGKNAWSQSLQTAKTAKQMGLIVFASPWGQPAEWKTNGTSNAKNEDGTTGKLKRENWPDYAQYLNDYVQYLRDNGVELDAISIQNEPDWAATYAGCLWSASEIAEFVKLYGTSISCKVMAPETLGVSDSYVNALNKADVLPGFEIYGGHQYGGIQSAYKQLAQKGKEIWMTEYLINWNEIENNTRNFDFSKDFFNFFRAINTCMLGDFNAWIHYAAKRYYGMLGDGQRGAGSSGTVTKRGYIMAHFAKYVTGMTRIDINLSATPLEGSAYLSETGDTLVAVLANATDEEATATFDLPFYTQGTALSYTSKTKSMESTINELDEETCRPVVTIPAQSVSTVLFVKSRDRQPSDMKGNVTRFDRLDDMLTTTTTFGTAYKLSGKTGKKFDSSNPLISSRKNTSFGYIALDDRYTELVMQIKKVTTTSSLTAGATTLYYVNAQGQAVNHVYGRMDLSRGENFALTFDLSSATLTDGCIGLLSLTCDNTQSHLTINFGDVYLSKGISTYHAKLTGTYVADDSFLLEYSSDPACTSIDMTEVTSLPPTLPWLSASNRVVYVAADSELSGSNVVKDGICASLIVNEQLGAFRPAQPFTAITGSYTCTVSGQHIVQLPFQATVPDGAVIYTLTYDLQPIAVTNVVPANQPLLVEAQGEVTFLGSGDVSYKPCLLSDDILPIVTPTSIQSLTTYQSSLTTHPFPLYDLQGRRMPAAPLKPGIYLMNGKKYVVK